MSFFQVHWTQHPLLNLHAIPAHFVASHQRYSLSGSVRPEPSPRRSQIRHFLHRQKLCRRLRNGGLQIGRCERHFEPHQTKRFVRFVGGHCTGGREGVVSCRPRQPSQQLCCHFEANPMAAFIKGLLGSGLEWRGDLVLFWGSRTDTEEFFVSVAWSE